MGHNDAGRDQARQFLAQARHQTDNALGILRKKAGTGPDTGLDVRGAGVAFDPLDTASGRLALAVGDLLQAVTLLLGDAPPDDNDQDDNHLAARLREQEGWWGLLDKRIARLEASVSTRDYAVPRPPARPPSRRPTTANVAFVESVVPPLVASTPEEEDAARHASYLRLRDQGLTPEEALADLGEPDPETPPPDTSYRDRGILSAPGVEPGLRAAADHLPFVAGEPDPETAPALPGEDRA